MTPQEPKPDPQAPKTPNLTVAGNLRILAPASNDTLGNGFLVDGVYTGAPNGTQVSLQLLYTDPSYPNTEQTVSCHTSDTYWTAMFSGISVVAGRKYKVVASSGGNSDSIDGLIVQANPPVPVEESGSFSEP